MQIFIFVKERAADITGKILNKSLGTNCSRHLFIKSGEKALSGPDVCYFNLEYSWQEHKRRYTQQKLKRERTTLLELTSSGATASPHPHKNNLILPHIHPTTRIVLLLSVLPYS